MEIIIEGRKVDTLDIWDIEIVKNTREVYILVKITDDKPIKIGRHISCETYPSEFRDIYAPYEKLYDALKTKWNGDKIIVPIFKL